MGDSPSPAPDGFEVRCFPGDDARFVARAHRAAREAVAEHPGSRLATRVEAILQPSYPLAHAQLQDPLAGDGDAVVLYVFRDGALVPDRRAPSRSGSGLAS